MTKPCQLFKCENSKSLCQWVIQCFPENYEKMVYVEPFCGSANIFINKTPSTEEVISDADQGIVKIMRAIRDQCDDFVSCLRKVKYTKDNFELAYNRKEFITCLDEAVNEFMLRRMSRNGLKKIFAPSSKQNAWSTTINCIPVVAKRMENVYIFNKNAIEVLSAFNLSNTLAYIDPPFTEHNNLSDLLKSYKGKVIVNGPVTPLYKTWRCIKNKTTTNCLWFNY